MRLLFKGQNNQAITGVVKADLYIVRTISGLSLKIACYLIDGNYIGSCVHKDLCTYIKDTYALNSENCPQSLIDYGFDCTCPWNLPINLVDIDSQIDIPALNVTPAPLPNPLAIFSPYFSSGDFNIDIKLSQSNTTIQCNNLKFSLKPK